MLDHQQVSTCDPLNEILSIWTFGAEPPTYAPLLTAQHKVLRRAWARQHRYWTVDDWKHVAWSDESRFQLYRADGRVRV